MSRAKSRLASQMTRTLPSRLFLLLCLLPFVARAEDLKKIQPTGYVTDLAGALTPEAKAQLEALCTELEQKTGAQMAIVTVHSLEGDEAQVYANKLFKQLGVGKKDDRGVMLLVAPDEHRYWTEVGYGLEPVINDARAGDAGRTMVPYFKRGDFSAGIQAGAWQLAKYIADDRNVALSGQSQIQTQPIRRETGRRETGIPFITLLIIGFVVFSILARVIGGLSNQAGRGGSSGSGCLWFLLGMLANSGGRSSGWGGGGGNWGGGGFGGGGGGFGGFGGGSSGGGGAGGSW